MRNRSSLSEHSWSSVATGSSKRKTEKVPPWNAPKLGLSGTNPGRRSQMHRGERQAAAQQRRDLRAHKETARSDCKSEVDSGDTRNPVGNKTPRVGVGRVYATIAHEACPEALHSRFPSRGFLPLFDGGGKFRSLLRATRTQLSLRLRLKSVGYS